MPPFSEYRRFLPVPRSAVLRGLTVSRCQNKPQAGFYKLLFSQSITDDGLELSCNIEADTEYNKSESKYSKYEQCGVTLGACLIILLLDHFLAKARRMTQFTTNLFELTHD